MKMQVDAELANLDTKWDLSRSSVRFPSIRQKVLRENYESKWFCITYTLLNTNTTVLENMFEFNLFCNDSLKRHIPMLTFEISTINLSLAGAECMNHQHDSDVILWNMCWEKGSMQEFAHYHRGNIRLTTIIMSCLVPNFDSYNICYLLFVSWLL
jgi:hypothetical protein